MNAPLTLPPPVPLDKPEAQAWWLPRHEAKLRAVREARAAGQPIDLGLIGDSITHGWEDEGRAVWDEQLAPRKAFGLGFWGDRTEHVLWRLQQGEVDGLAPRLVVLMIGTNDTGDRQDPPELTAAGIARLVQELRRRLPGSRLLLLAIFPRDADAASPLRHLNERINALIAPLADGDAVHFLDINAAFTQADGSLSPEVLPDQLHLSELGYRLWAQAMLPTVDRLLSAPTLEPSLPCLP